MVQYCVHILNSAILCDLTSLRVEVVVVTALTGSIENQTLCFICYERKKTATPKRCAVFIRTEYKTKDVLKNVFREQRDNTRCTRFRNIQLLYM